MLSALIASVASSILTVLVLRVYEPSDGNLLLVLVTVLVLIASSGWYRFHNVSNQERIDGYTGFFMFEC